nr:MAG TPA: Hepatitis C virus core protein [Caudoviricetes sp.]
MQIHSAGCSFSIFFLPAVVSEYSLICRKIGNDNTAECQ